MTILLIFSTILLKTITFLFICYLLAKTSMLERELERLKLEKNSQVLKSILILVIQLHFQLLSCLIPPCHLYSGISSMLLSYFYLSLVFLNSNLLWYSLLSSKRLFELEVQYLFSLHFQQSIFNIQILLWIVCEIMCLVIYLKNSQHGRTFLDLFCLGMNIYEIIAQF